MRDQYPAGSSVPQHCLVPSELQPDFGDLPGCDIPEIADLGHAICSTNLEAGRADDVAVLHAGSARRYTFGELDDLSTRLAAGLRSIGVGLGDRIAFRSPNVPEIAVVALAAWKAGAVVVPTPAQVRSDELRFYLEDTGPRVLFVFGRAALFEEVPQAIEGTSVEHVIAFGGDAPLPGARSWEELLAIDTAENELAPVPSDSVAIVWHTGGTTGRPKAIYHTHRRALLGSHALSRATGIAAGERWSAAAPVGHALGFASHTFWPLLHGATVVMIEDFPSATALLDAISTHRVNGFAAITVTWARMLDELERDPRDVSSLRRTYAMWQSASSTHVYDGWQKLGHELRNNFGCTAFASWILAPSPSEPVPRTSLGRAVPGYEVVALDLESNEIVPVSPGVQGRLAARGVSGLTYWNRPELQRRDVRDGWVLIDDVVSFNEDGNAMYYGRTDYVISTAGYKVTPVEVEEALATHEAVSEVGVIGAPDPIRQEIVAAFVALAPGYEPDDDLKRELQDYAKFKLAPYKYPRRVEFVAALPRDHVGKLQPRVLREWAQREQESEIAR
jgi:2-aminobenzoate-CoA ligase